MHDYEVSVVYRWTVRWGGVDRLLEHAKTVCFCVFSQTIYPGLSDGSAQHANFMPDLIPGASGYRFECGLLLWSPSDVRNLM